MLETWFCTSVPTHLMYGDARKTKRSCLCRESMIYGCMNILRWCIHIDYRLWLTIYNNVVLSLYTLFIGIVSHIHHSLHYQAFSLHLYSAVLVLTAVKMTVINGNSTSYAFAISYYSSRYRVEWTPRPCTRIYLHTPYEVHIPERALNTWKLFHWQRNRKQKYYNI